MLDDPVPLDQPRMDHDRREDPNHLKALVLRMYWDGEAAPSVEAPVGDFFGLGLGDYFLYESYPLAVGADKALNAFFPMPFQKRGRITVTNEGSQTVKYFYYNIDYRTYSQASPPNCFIFTRSIARRIRRKAGPLNGSGMKIR